MSYSIFWVQVFAADGRTLLRQLKGHQQAVHVVQFSLDRLHIFSGGDDATVSFSPAAHRDAMTPFSKNIASHYEVSRWKSQRSRSSRSNLSSSSHISHSDVCFFNFDLHWQLSTRGRIELACKAHSNFSLTRSNSAGSILGPFKWRAVM